MLPLVRRTHCTGPSVVFSLRLLHGLLGLRWHRYFSLRYIRIHGTVRIVYMPHPSVSMDTHETYSTVVLYALTYLRS